MDKEPTTTSKLLWRPHSSYLHQDIAFHFCSSLYDHLYEQILHFNVDASRWHAVCVLIHHLYIHTNNRASIYH